MCVFSHLILNGQVFFPWWHYTVVDVGQFSYGATVHSTCLRYDFILVFKDIIFMTDSAGFDQETWLKDAVLNVFLDTRDCPPSLVRFVSDN